METVSLSFKHCLLLPLLTLLSFACLAQEEDDVKWVKYRGEKFTLQRVYFKDKASGGYSLENPQAYLSERAIGRRERQGIRVDSLDLPVSHCYIEQLEKMGCQVVAKSRWLNTAVVRIRKQADPSRLERLPFVKAVKKVYVTPDSVRATSPRLRWHSELVNWGDGTGQHYGSAQEQITMLQGDRLHQSGYKGKGMMIAVLDGGFMNADEIPCLQKANVVDLQDCVYPKSKSVFREMEHGTMVLSTMAVNEPGNFVGTAPAADYCLYRSEVSYKELSAEEDFWVMALERADSVGADVVNSSLGFHYFDDKFTKYNYSDQDGNTAFSSRAASRAASRGMVLVVSAGNDGMGAWKKINFPADADDIITVGAVTPDKVNAAFSSIGPASDGRIKPDVMALGSPTAVITGRGTIAKNVGTSFSAPIVAGLVACLWQALPEKRANEIISLVRQASNRYAKPDNIFGFGVTDFWKAYLLGKGRK